MSATTDGSTVAVTKKPNAEDTVQRTTAMAGFACACSSSELPRDRRRASGGGGEPSLFPLAHWSKVGGGEAAVKRRGSPPSRLSRSARALR